MVDIIRRALGGVPTFGAIRSSKWSAVRREFLKQNPLCAVCGKKGTILSQNEIHHQLPFHIDKSKELEKSNLITLCRQDHFSWGHLYSWSSWNKDIEEEARHWRDKVVLRP